MSFYSNHLAWQQRISSEVKASGKMNDRVLLAGETHNKTERSLHEMYN